MIPKTPSITISDTLFNDISGVAASEGVTVEAWVVRALTEHLRMQRRYEKLFGTSADGREADAKQLVAMLDQGPNRDPDPGDEL